MIITCALLFEAKPLIEKYSLKPISNKPFSIFANDDISLIVTGVGKHNMTVATSYILGLKGTSHAVINFGIAGSFSLEIGHLMMPSYIKYEMKRHYLSFAFKPRLTLSPLVSVDSPASNIEHGFCVDMEAFSFYETAKRFVPLELIGIIKHISDQGAYHHEELGKKKLRSQIQSNLNQIDKVLHQYQKLSKSLPTPVQINWDNISCTASEKEMIQLQMQRAYALGIDSSIVKSLYLQKNNGSYILNKLKQLIDKTEINLA